MKKSRESIEEVLEYPILAIPSRGLTKETCEMLGIRTALSEEDGETPVAYYFPYFNSKDKLVGFKKRNLLLPKDEDGHFTTVGKVSASCKLFGQNVAEKLPRKRKKLFYVEGEFDVASVIQACLEALDGTKFEGMVPFVVGLNCGTANAVESTMSNEDFLLSFERVVLGFDNDECTPFERRRGVVRGKEATENVATALMHPETFIINYSDEYKDPNDMLLDGQGAALQKLFSFEAKRFSAEKILAAKDIDFDEIIKARVKGIMVDCFPDLMKKIGGFRTRELITVTAPSGVGKSLTTATIMNYIYSQGGSCGCIMLEESEKETLQRFIAQKLHINYNKFKDNPEKYATRAEIRAAYDEVTENDKLWIVDHFGSMPLEALMQKIKTLVFVNKVQYILLDHLSMVISGLAVKDERKSIDMVMTELAAFCAANDVCIIVVNHINRSVVQNFKPPEDAEDQPYWVPVAKESMRGSSALEGLSWIVLGLEPQILPDKSRGHVRWVVLKNRPWGFLGVADEFIIDDDTGEVLLKNQDFH